MATTTPWGPAQQSERIAPGIVSYSTAGHGGIHLSELRQAELLRQLPGVNTWAGGPWYEEDCDWCLPAIVFEAEFRTFYDATTWTSGQAMMDCAKDTFRNYRPEAYERFYGVTLQPGESRRRDEQLFAVANVRRLVSISAAGDWHKDCPKGMVLVTACIGGRLDNGQCASQGLRHFLIPEAEYHGRGPFGFVIDLARHQELTEVSA